MTVRSIWKARAVGFVVGCVLAALLVSLVQTQFNLAALVELGADISAATRIEVSLLDLIGFGPAILGVIAAAFLLAFPVAALLQQMLSALPRGLLFALAAATAMLAALSIMQALLQITPVAAAREAPGLLALCLCAAPGGWIYARITRR